MTKQIFFTVSEKSYRFGELNQTKEKHFIKKEDALDLYNEFKEEYSNSASYQNQKETVKEKYLLFEADSLGDEPKWGYEIELFEQKLN